LRLTVARGCLGIESYEAMPLGPLELSELTLSLPELSFPVDLSGGVPRFRHRRGQLQRLVVKAALPALTRWAEPRLRNVLPELTRPPTLWWTGSALGVGLCAERAALAFELLWAPEDTTARWVVHAARGVGLPGAALGHALRAVDGLAKGWAERRGRTLELTRATHRLLTELLPPLGVRVPQSAAARFGACAVEGDQLVMSIDSQNPVTCLVPTTVAYVDLARSIAAADELLSEGKPDDARHLYLAALEQAPRHPALIQLIAEIDATVGERQEAALALLIEGGLATHAGAVGAVLLSSNGDADSAREAFERAADGEAYAPLAALLSLRASEMNGGDEASSLRSLDEAIARCPDLAEPRWARLQTRVRCGDVAGARSDLQHLEASSRGSQEKFAVCLRGGTLLLDEGLVRPAASLFERALRYVPDALDATVGLARALRGAGRADRALALLQRALRLVPEQENPPGALLIELARLLATQARDLPQAIARVREVAGGNLEIQEARHLEALWRASLGDIAGASIAYGRMRETLAMSATRAEEAPRWLREAGHFELEVCHDLLAAEKHLTLALRLAPQDDGIADSFRRVAAALAVQRRQSRARDEGVTGAAGDEAQPELASEGPAPGAQPEGASPPDEEGSGPATRR